MTAKGEGALSYSVTSADAGLVGGEIDAHSGHLKIRANHTGKVVVEVTAAGNEVTKAGVKTLTLTVKQLAYTITVNQPTDVQAKWAGDQKWKASDAVESVPDGVQLIYSLMVGGTSEGLVKGDQVDPSTGELTLVANTSGIVRVKVSGTATDLYAAPTDQTITLTVKPARRLANSILVNNTSPTLQSKTYNYTWEAKSALGARAESGEDLWFDVDSDPDHLVNNGKLNNNRTGEMTLVANHIGTATFWVTSSGNNEYESPDPVKITLTVTSADTPITTKADYQLDPVEYSYDGVHWRTDGMTGEMSNSAHAHGATDVFMRLHYGTGSAHWNVPLPKVQDVAHIGTITVPTNEQYTVVVRMRVPAKFNGKVTPGLPDASEVDIEFGGNEYISSTSRNMRVFWD